MPAPPGGLILEVAAKKKAFLLVERKEKEATRQVLGGSRAEENAEWQEISEAVWAWTEINDCQKATDLTTFMAQDKVMLSLGFQCVAWSKPAHFGEILTKDKHWNVLTPSREHAVLRFACIFNAPLRVESDSVCLNHLSSIKIYFQSNTRRKSMGVFQIIAMNQ